MNILFKRNYKLILGFILIFALSIIFSWTRMISYNFWKYETELEVIWENINNSKDILDDSIFHEININIANNQYEYILKSYKENQEKEYIKTNITIDWVLIENVWLRLKWNVDLLEILTSQDSENIEFIKPSLLINFDKFTEGQTYQGLSEIALRIDSNESILWQLVSFKMINELWLYSPDIWYTSLKFWNYWTYLYMVSEVINDDYVEKNFTQNWVLYKALNSLSFSYLWDDPTSYDDLFEQKTQINNYDLALLIDILDFVSNSTDEEFENNLESYIDLDSYFWLLTMDELLWRKDKLLALLNNYYIYIDTDTWKASFISRDQKMSFWNTNTPAYEILLKYYTKNELENLDDIWLLLSFTQRWVKKDKPPKDKTYLDDLRKRVFESEKFREMFQEKLISMKNEVYSNSLASESLSYYKNIFLNYENYSLYSSYTDYEYIVDSIEDYIENIILIINQRISWISKP